MPSSADDIPLDKIAPALKSGVLARIKNPLTGSFIVSWIVYNWKILVLLVGPWPTAQDRIQSIQLVLSEQGVHLVPALFALAYFTVSPWIWLGVRTYLDIPEARAKKVDRRKLEEDKEYEAKSLEKDLKLVFERRQLLESARDLSAIREQIALFFEQSSLDYQKKCEAFSAKTKSLAELEERSLTSKLGTLVDEQLRAKKSAFEQLAEVVKADVDNQVSQGVLAVQQEVEKLGPLAKGILDESLAKQLTTATSVVSEAAKISRDLADRLHDLDRRAVVAMNVLEESEKRLSQRTAVAEATVEKLADRAISKVGTYISTLMNDGVDELTERVTPSIRKK
jgi:hypothetical protein